VDALRKISTASRRRLRTQLYRWKVHTPVAAPVRAWSFRWGPRPHGRGYTIWSLLKSGAHPAPVARTTCCPGARSAQEVTEELALRWMERPLGSPPVACGHPDNKLSGPPKVECTILLLVYSIFTNSVAGLDEYPERDLCESRLLLKPEASRSRSRWLSESASDTTGKREKISRIPRDTGAPRPPPGSDRGEIFRWCRPVDLNHRLRLLPSLRLGKPTFAEVSERVGDTLSPRASGHGPPLQAETSLGSSNDSKSGFPNWKMR
jgi:hypothetical protein